MRTRRNHAKGAKNLNAIANITRCVDGESGALGLGRYCGCSGLRLGRNLKRNGFVSRSGLRRALHLNVGIKQSRGKLLGGHGDGGARVSHGLRYGLHGSGGLVRAAGGLDARSYHGLGIKCGPHGGGGGGRLLVLIISSGGRGRRINGARLILLLNLLVRRGGRAILILKVRIHGVLVNQLHNGGVRALLFHVLVKRNVAGELVDALVRGDRIHNAKHGGNGRLVADGTGRVRKHKLVGYDRHGVGKGNQRDNDGEDPKHDLCRGGHGQKAHHGQNRGGNHGEGQQLHQHGPIRSIGLLRQKVRARGIIVGDHHNRAVTRRRQGTRGLVVCDNVLTQAAGSHVGEHGMAGAFHDKQHRAGERDDDAHNADGAADAHKDRAHKDHDAHSCLGNLFAGRSAKFLNLGLKAMVSEDIGNDVSGCAPPRCMPA